MDIREEYYRPKQHYSPRRNWMNDPNGCVFHQGEYHLFYQYHPESNKWGPMHWGHAVSRDLLDWTEREIAIYPDENGYAYSGSAVVDRNNRSGLFDDDQGLILFYTGHKEAIANDKEPLQSQCLAFSKDGGRIIEKYHGNPIIENPGKKDFRDPKVFYHQETDRWIMVLTGGQQIEFYNSINLIQWTRIGQFTLELKDFKGDWECPDLFPIYEKETGETHWILTFSILSREAKPSQVYYIGKFNGLVFTPYSKDSYGVADYGYDFYAAQSWSYLPKKDPENIWIGWANNWNYAMDTPDMSWRGSMSFPREVSLVNLNDQLFIKQRPAGELENEREEIYCHQNVLIGQLILEPKHNVLELDLKKLKVGPKDSIELDFHWARGKFANLSISEEIISFDRGHCGDIFQESPFGLSSFTLPQLESPASLRLFLDRSLMEIYFNDGLAVMTNQIFPDGPLERIEITTGKNSAIGECTLYRF